MDVVHIGATFGMPDRSRRLEPGTPSAYGLRCPQPLRDSILDKRATHASTMWHRNTNACKDSPRCNVTCSSSVSINSGSGQPRPSCRFQVSDWDGEWLRSNLAAAPGFQADLASGDRGACRLPEYDLDHRDQVSSPAGAAKTSW